jgi:hypothetical protein
MGGAVCVERAALGGRRKAERRRRRARTKKNRATGRSEEKKNLISGSTVVSCYRGCDIEDDDCGRNVYRGENLDDQDV